jgi:hypothetical protein
VRHEFGGELQREARLAHAADAGDGDDGRLIHRPRHSCQFGIASDERRRARRQIAGEGVEGPQAREVREEAGGMDLEDVLGTGEVSELVIAEIDERDVVRNRVADELLGRS